MAGIGTLTIAAGGIGTTLSFSAGGGLEIGRGGFGYKTGNELTWTTFDLVSHETDATFRSKLYQIDRNTEYAQNYASDPTNSDVIYLTWASDGEESRRTPVFDMTYELLPEENFTGMLGRNVGKLRLAVQHPPYWEAATAATFRGTLPTLGGTMKITQAELSYPARIGTFIVAGYNDEFGFSLEKFWAGIRDTRQGLAYFNPVWECEKGSLYTDASTGTAASVSNGSVVNVTFATGTTMVKRFEVQTYNISTASYSDYVGRYLVLSRMKLIGTAAEIAVELRHGWLGETGMEASVGQTYLSMVDNASLVNYNLIPLGVVDVPPTGDRNQAASVNLMSRYGLAVYAERLGTAGTAVFDCFILIPTDHMLVIGSAIIHDFTGRSLKAYVGEEDTSYAVCTGIGGIRNCEFTFDNWNIPVSPSNYSELVVAAQAGTIHQFGGTVVVGGSIIPRFRSYRST